MAGKLGTISVLQPSIQQKGFRNRTKTFPKFGISGKQAQMAMCLADGQPLASHSKKNLERHFIWLQNNYIESEKAQSDLRTKITLLEKKNGGLSKNKKEKTSKKTRFASRDAPRK